MRALPEYVLDNVVEYVAAQDPMQQTVFMNSFLRFVALLVAEITKADDRGHFVSRTGGVGSDGKPPPGGPGDGGKDGETEGFAALQTHVTPSASRR